MIVSVPRMTVINENNLIGVAFPLDLKREVTASMVEETTMKITITKGD